MPRNLTLASATFLVFLAATPVIAQVAAPPAAGPADGITMEMMPISADQIKSCRDQASSQLASEQDTLHKREHGQDNDKMKQGAVTGITGAATSAISRNRGYGWWGGNNNGAQTAAATGATQRTDRNSEAVASTTGIGQDVGKDAYSQCVAGIKGPEYVHFRQTGKIVAFTGSAPDSSPTPAMAAAATPAPLPSTASPVQDEGDGKHFLLTAPGQTDAREVTALPGMKNAYVEEVTGDKYFVLGDGSVKRVAKAGGLKTASK
ncbi:hypothetical protein [Granulicella sibirica]|uniref:Uncharacterized protein n=1 Tax=Granulicella sibirica TaxID=2479048 RepID=A0A4Q0SYV4_9BACT|nr:hypothetical protein [Granulicella sibirica]RXH56405.1 hypothetical protein GRAN_3262 [Granulicella sibirica]